jgi:hypothetical protein
VLTSYRERISRIAFCSNTSPDGINASSGTSASCWCNLLRTSPSKAVMFCDSVSEISVNEIALMDYLAKLLSLRQEELVLRPQKFILMAGIGVFFLQLLNDVPWRNDRGLSKRGYSDETHLSPAISSRTELGIESCRVEDGDSLPVC